MLIGKVIADSDTESVISISDCHFKRQDSPQPPSPLPPLTPPLALVSPIIAKLVNHWKSLTKVNKGRVSKKPAPVTYKTVSRDLDLIQANSLQNSFNNRPYSDILRNQLIRAHCHSLLEIALRFEGYRQRYPHNKDPTWFTEKVAADLFVFTDQLQGISALPEASRRITAIDFEELAQPAKLGPFVGFSDPRKVIDHFKERTLENRIQ